MLFRSLETQSGFIGLEDAEFYLATEGNMDAQIFLRVTQQTGEPPGGLDQTPGTNFAVPGNDDPGLPYENIVIPETGPL